MDDLVKILSARNSLYLAVMQSTEADDEIIMNHVCAALVVLDEVLGDGFPENTREMMERKRR